MFRFLSRPLVPGIVLAVLAAAGVATYLYFAGETPSVATSFEAQEEDDTQRPTGAGTLPDGIADARQEGIQNRVEGETLPDGSNPTNLRSPFLETEPDPDRRALNDPMEQLDEAKENLSEMREDATMGTSADTETGPSDG